MEDGSYDDDEVSGKVKTKMGHLLKRVRQNPVPHPNEVDFDVESDLSDQEDLQDYEDDYVEYPTKGNWEIRYDNQNYIRSLVNEDKGYHRLSSYPKHKWEVSFDEHPYVRTLEPYPVRVSIDHGSGRRPQWDIPYDNKNYVLSMLAGAGISKIWKEGLHDRERAIERYGQLRNPYDYGPEKVDVVHARFRERKPRRESYRFDRVERNIHDYENESDPGNEVIRLTPRQQRRRSTNVYRYGDVERNVHDYSGNTYTRSPPRHGKRTRFDAINKWKRGMDQSDYDAQNAYNDELQRHYNQYGVEASAHDYDENRVIRSSGARKRIVPLPLVNLMRKPRNVINRLNRMKAQEDYDALRYGNISTPGDLYDDVVETHQNHPNDYSSETEDVYEQYVDDGGSQTWESASEKYAHVSHRSQ